jgi:Rad3-related DNA helicase
MTNLDWKTLFPYRQVREQQSHAIESILEHFNKGGRFYALEAGTGVGKSAIGLTVARVLAHAAPVPEGYEPGAYFLTTQKMLQEQYIKDFSKQGMCSIKSASNYQCGYRKVISCAEGQNEIKTLDPESNQWKACNFGCVYRAEKQAFLDSRLSVTNFSYMLTDANYGSKIKPRQLLVIDEAHNVETELSKFIEITVSEKFSKDVLHLNFPDLQTHLRAYSWICESYWPKLDSHLKHMQKTLDQYQKLKENLDQFASLSKQLKLMETHHQKIKQFIELHDQNNWVFETLTSEQMGYRKFSFKPIDVSHFAEQYLFRLGHQVLFMSATLLRADKFAESLGIIDKNFSNVCIPSPFPEENRPIVFAPMGKMAASSIDQTLPSMAKAIQSILDQHKNEKGIIHCIHGDSQITMASGQQKALRDVRPGEYVLSYDENSKVFEAQKVTNFWNRGIKPTLTIELENNKTITCTPDHKFLTRNRGWVEAENLTFEDDIIDISQV